MSKYGRIVSVTLGEPGTTGRRLASVQSDGTQGLRIGFGVRRTATGEDDTATVNLYGVAQRTIAELQESSAYLSIAAGYGKAHTLASGYVVPGSLRVTRESRVPIVTVSVSDGGIQARAADVSKAWSQVSSDEAWAYAIGQSGLDRGIYRPGRSVTYARGLYLLGTAAGALDRLAADTGSRWGVTAGAVDVWPDDGTRTQRAVVLSSSTGLLPDPEPVDGGRWRCTVLLEPSLLPGDTVSVRSDALRGLLRLDSVEHAGDSGYAGDYFTAVTGAPV